MRRSSWPNYIYISTVVLAISLGLVLAGAGPLTAQDQAQLRLNTAAPVPHGDTVIGQTFVAGHNGLSAVELLAVVYPDKPAVVSLQVVDAQTNLVASEVFTQVRHNAPLRLNFKPQPDSAGQTYTLRLTGPAENAMTVWAYGLDGYTRGTLLVEGTPATGDLRFSTTYTYLWPDALLETAAGLGRLVTVAIPLWLIFFAPGLLLLNWLTPGADCVALAWVRWGLALTLSLSLVALAWLWVTVCGGRLWGEAVWAVYVIIGVAVAWQWLRRWKARPFAWRLQLSAGDVLLALILLATLVTRLLAARDLAFPAWVDSPHHYTIARLMAETGRVPDNYHPLLSVDHFTYHFGFHALAVTMSWLTSLSLVDTFLLIGHLLQGLMPLVIYAATVMLTDRPRAGLWAAFVSGLVSFFPGYYLTWGRYTQLAGLLILAPGLALLWRMVAPKPDQGKEVLPLRPAVTMAVVAGVMLAGLFLTHYRVAIFAGIFVLVATGLGAKGGWKRIGLAAAIGGGLILPWGVRLVVLEVWPLLNAPATAAATSGYNAFPWAYFQSSLEKGWLLAAALAALWGLVHRERVVWVVAGWAAVLFALLNIGPGSWIVNNNSWAISIFVPGAILVGWGVDQWLVAASGLMLPDRRWVSRGAGGVLGVLLAGVAAYAGLQGARAQVGIVNVSTVLASVADKTALEWLDQNTSPKAVFLVSSWVWSSDIWSAADAGIWLWPLMGRATTAPPIDYIYQPGWKTEVNTFNVRVAKIKDWTTPEAQALLHDAGVTHVFIGERGGNLKPELFMDKPGYHLIYSNGADWVFELK